VIGAAALIQGSSPTLKCCRGVNPVGEVLREHAMFAWYVVIEIVDFGKTLKEGQSL